MTIKTLKVISHGHYHFGFNALMCLLICNNHILPYILKIIMSYKFNSKWFHIYKGKVSLKVLDKFQV